MISSSSQLQRSSTVEALEQLHPMLWRASQLGKSVGRCIDSGHVALSSQLPGGGWPAGSQIDFLVQQHGTGEMRLLGPALRQVAKKKIILITPPHAPQIISLASIGVDPAQVIWIRSKTSANAFWAAEQALSGCFGAVLFWSNHARSEALRRLNLAAQSGETLFVMFRPLAAAQDPSPASLRLALRPAAGGIELTFVKRKGPQRDSPLFIPLPLLTPTRAVPRDIPMPSPVDVRDRARVSAASSALPLSILRNALEA